MFIYTENDTESDTCIKKNNENAKHTQKLKNIFPSNPTKIDNLKNPDLSNKNK